MARTGAAACLTGGCWSLPVPGSRFCEGHLPAVPSASPLEARLAAQAKERQAERAKRREADKRRLALIERELAAVAALGPDPFASRPSPPRGA